MGRIAIIDGYNVIRRNAHMSALLKKDIGRSREQLISLVVSHQARRSVFEKVIIVFDGKGEAASLERDRMSAGVSIIFSSAKVSADDMIRALIKKFIATKRLTVISDDNYVSNTARAFGADIMATGMFLASVGYGLSQRVPGKQHDESKDVDPQVMREITETMKKVWHIR